MNRDKIKAIWDKLPSQNIGLPQFKSLINSLDFKTYFAGQIATANGEDSVLISIQSTGYGRDVGIKLVRRSGFNGSKYTTVKSSNVKYLSMRVSNGFVNSPKLVQFLKTKKIKTN